MSELPDPQTGAAADADLESLKTRLHVYESFDSVIAEHTAKARAILMEAAELRERVERELARERDVLNAEITDRRNRLDAEFVGLRAAFDADLAARRQAFEQECAERRVQLDTELAAISDLVANERQRQAAAKSSLAATARAILAMVGDNPEPESPPSVAPEVHPSAPEPEPVPTPTVHDKPDEPASTPEPAESETGIVPNPVITPPAETVKTTVIVHGIFRPIVATGLQRYLLAQDGVISVEPREFAEGILRLQIRSSRPVARDVFDGWADGEGMMVVQRAPQTLEITLPAANQPSD